MPYKIQYEIFWDEFCQWPRTLVHQRVTYELYDFYLSDPSKWITRVLLKDSIVRPSTNWRFQTSFTSNVRIFISSSRNTVYRTIDGWENILKVRYEPDTRYKRVGIALLGIQIGKVARRASSRWNRSMDVILVPVNYQPWCTVLSGGKKWMTSSTPTDRAWNIETNVWRANFSSLQTISYHLCASSVNVCSSHLNFLYLRTIFSNSAAFLCTA